MLTHWKSLNSMDLILQTRLSSAQRSLFPEEKSLLLHRRLPMPQLPRLNRIWVAVDRYKPDSIVTPCPAVVSPRVSTERTALISARRAELPFMQRLMEPSSLRAAAEHGMAAMVIMSLSPTATVHRRSTRTSGGLSLLP